MEKCFAIVEKIVCTSENYYHAVVRVCDYLQAALNDGDISVSEYDIIREWL